MMTTVMTTTMIKTTTARQITKTQWLCCCLAVLLLTSPFAAGQNNSANVAGKWQLSWEARLGTARGTLQLEQVGSKLTGSFDGGSLGSPKISGTVEGKNITLTLDFQRAHPFTLVFTGTIDGDKMGGKFDIRGVQAGYDSHGENARPSNYSWTAVRQPDQTRSETYAKPVRSSANGLQKVL